ncbi:MAG: glycosyltransferase [Bacteroidia bacterium]|nr:glycosyltransferase [Bacteroidia bacterium]
MKNTNPPFVSVVMTSYNRGHYIGQAIDSILAQECSFPIEIIIGDDGSTDNSRELLSQYHEKYSDIIVLNFQEHNVGFGPNWASTCKLARGKYIAFLDDDDYWCDEHRLQEMVDFLESNDEYGLVYTNRYVLDVAKGTMTLTNSFIPENVVDVCDYLDSGGGFPILFSTTILRKSLMDKHVNLDDYIRLEIPIQDWPTAMLIAPYCKFHYMEKPSVVYRSYQGSMSKPQEYHQIERKYSKELIMNRYVHDQLGIPFDEPGWYCFYYHLLLSVAYNRGEYKRARKYAKLTGSHKLKALCAKTWITFWVFILAKNVWHKIRPRDI